MCTHVSRHFVLFSLHKENVTEILGKAFEQYEKVTEMTESCFCGKHFQYAQYAWYL